MIANVDSHKGWRAYRCVGVVIAAALIVFGGMLGSLPRADVAGALGGVVGEPGDPTVAPTAPGTVTPTVAPTAPPVSVEPTSPPTDAPVTSSVATWDQSGSSDQSSEEWQAPSQSSASASPQSTYDAGVTDTTTPVMTTTQDLLVGPSTTRAAPTTVTPRDVDSSVARTGGSSDPKIWAVVGALGAVAVGLGIATVLYWRRTRPEAEATGGGNDDHGNRIGSRRRSRYADLVVTSPDPQ